MNLSVYDLVDLWKLKTIKVKVIKPIRTGDHYKHGSIIGFKCGIWGGGHFDYEKGSPMRFDSRRIHQLKEPKIHVQYNVYDFGGKVHSDWIPMSYLEISYEPKPIEPMLQLLKILMEKLPAGWSLSFTARKGFYESSEHKGLVIEIDLITDARQHVSVGITKELVENGEPEALRVALDEQLGELFKKLGL